MPIIPLRVLEQKWKAYDHYPDELRRFALSKARQKSGDLFNDQKIRVAGDFVEGDVADVAIQETDYLSSLMTDQLAWNRVRSTKLAADKTSPQATLWDGTSAFLEKEYGSRSLRLKGFSEAIISNQLGASTLAFSRDGQLMIVYQNSRNLQSTTMLAPSGSGSLDWSDLKASEALDLLSLARYGAERELREECALDDDQGTRPPIPSKIMVTGFTRMLHRAGKPEFFCLARIDAPSVEICARKPERYVECVLPSSIERANWQVARPRDEIRRVCEDYLFRALEHEGARMPLSYPLEHSLKLLIELCQDPDAADVLDRFMLDDIVQ